MSQYGDVCRLCGAQGDYCIIQLARGLDFDCRLLTDMLTDEQCKEMQEWSITPEWWLEMQDESE